VRATCAESMVKSGPMMGQAEAGQGFGLSRRPGEVQTTTRTGLAGCDFGFTAGVGGTTSTGTAAW
jgi:hypothetical protein